MRQFAQGAQLDERLIISKLSLVHRMKSLNNDEAYLIWLVICGIFCVVEKSFAVGQFFFSLSISPQWTKSQKSTPSTVCTVVCLCELIKVTQSACYIDSTLH